MHHDRMATALLTLGICAYALGGEAPPNDVCESALPLTLGAVPIDTSNATTGPPWNDFQNCENFGFFQVYSDIWYEWTAPDSNDLRLDLCDAATFDTRIAFYEGTCAGLELIACNDDGLSCHDNTSQLDVSVIGGTRYLVRIGSFSEGGGTGTMTVTFPWHECLTPLPPCPEDFDGDLQVDVDDILVVLGSWGAWGPPRPSGDCAPLPNGDCAAGVDDLLAVLAAMGPCDLTCDQPWMCGDHPPDFRCDAELDTCICMLGFDGNPHCINIAQDRPCYEIQSCPDGTCPPGWVCTITCCNDPKCMPLCETPIPGACCIDYACTIDFEDICVAAGGTWLGPYTTCEGNPCFDPSCADGFECGDDHTLFGCDEDDEECLCFATVDGGATCITLEFGHECGELYAPCLNGQCPDGYVCAEACCGTPLCWPVCGTASPTGACCLEDACVQMEYEPCFAVDGQWQGWGVSCDAVTCPPACTLGEVPDCNGVCAPAEWIGDGTCDDGTYLWNGIPIYFNCEAFGCDGGDCVCLK